MPQATASRCATSTWAAFPCASCPASRPERSTAMPIAMIHIAAGRSEETKRALLSNVTEAIARSLDAPVASVRVLLQEVPETHWASGGVTLAERRQPGA
ncbi:2-hydroxymuconate tautomerase family protein [Kerstersia gyiorum]|nr:2-hydroxymuconate tautomerase family protein [Kerstersia gyiorum]MCR4160362.1 2-hydroxymuconate tautomerase family protein [Kerstersia gyiorum]